MRIRPVALSISVIVLALAGPAVQASEWPSWRGPTQNGLSPERGLISEWSVDGKNLIWHAEHTGRSTPIVFDGRACATGRVGEGLEKQEFIACYDAETGEKVWEHRYNAFHTTIPFARVGWPKPVGDPKTGNLYVQAVGGLLMAIDKKGKILWERSLTEEFGRFSGYGGRTHSPILDEDRVVLGMTAVSWGTYTRPDHRYYAFDAKTGEIVWIASVAGPAVMKTTYSTPVVAIIDGQRLLIGGNSDGAIYALQARTGKLAWKFQLTKSGLNTSVAVEGTTVFAATGDETIDEAIMGRVVAIDGTGSGDVTATHELWRATGLKVKYASPTVKDGIVYVVDDAANLHALDAKSGVELWDHSIGTVGRGSPVIADGKLYATEVNGRFAILEANRDGVTVLDVENVEMEGGRYAEIYGSPAIAYGRIYFTAESGIYCLGDPSIPFKADAGTPPVLDDGQAVKGAEVATVLVVPGDITLDQGESASFVAYAFDSKGHALGKVKGNWSMQGMVGTVKNGKLTPDARAGGQAGLLTVNAAGQQASARVRVVPTIPFEEDFKNIAVGRNPRWFVGAGSRFKVEEMEGGKVLAKPPAGRGLERQIAFLGRSDAVGYTIQADLMGTRVKRRRPDMGLVAGRYILDLQGNHQRLQIRDWAEEPYQKTIDFAWETETWYTMKMQVDVDENGTTIRGKLWKRTEAEPSDWTITAVDPAPNVVGSPGLYGYAPTTIYFDNVKVTESE